MDKGTVEKLWRRYRYAVFIVLAGVVLMLLPTGTKQTQETPRAVESGQEVFSLEEMERRMEQILGQIDGVGQLHLMLTLKSGTELQLAEDTELTRQADGSGDSRRQVLTVNRGGAQQEVVVTGQTYPAFQGAVVVCQGADNSAVRLAVAEAVAALTGLRSDKISIVKWQS